jgi:adenylate cyclase
MERRLAAILAADVVGYSHMMAEDEAGTYDSLRCALSDIVVPTVEGNGGKLFKTTGDGFLAAFGSVSQALEAAVAIQEAFATKPLTLRIGINLGDVIAADGDMFGDGVNIAARLESMAEPGGIYVSAPVVRSVGRHPEIAFVRLGLRRAKNLPDPIEVYAAKWGAGVGQHSWRRWRQPVAAGIATLAVFVAAGAAWTHRETLVPVVAGAGGLHTGDEAGVPADEERPAVAVLPFDNLSGDPAQDYFSDGLTEDIITDLARNDELLVIARNSTFAYRDNPVDVRTVGAELGAGYVVEGSARRVGDRLRVTAQLVETDAGAHLWSDSYDRRIEDVFVVQADLTAQIVAALVSHVSRSEVDALRSRPTESLRAYDLVLRGRQHQHGAMTAESLLQARDSFARAVALDPDYAAAHAYLGLTYVKDHALRLTEDATDSDLKTGLDHIREARARSAPPSAPSRSSRATPIPSRLWPRRRSASAPTRKRWSTRSARFACIPSRLSTTPMFTGRRCTPPDATKTPRTSSANVSCARRRRRTACACAPPSWYASTGPTRRGRSWRA